MSEAVALQTRQNSVMVRMGERYGVDPNKLYSTLKATAFKGDVSNEQMLALMIVADQFHLNPLTKEIYAFPDKQNGIVPVVGVDGWSRIINEHPQFDGIDFEQTDESCTCTIYRKDRQHPIRVTEYLSECKRNTVPWGSHPRRMLRHKAMIQCSRLAFGYSGIYDQDEAERIIEGSATTVPPMPPESAPVIETLNAKIAKRKPDPAVDLADDMVYTYAEVRDRLEHAKTDDDRALAQDMIRSVADEAQRAELSELAKLLADKPE